MIRLFVDGPILEGQGIPLSIQQSHYVKHVMRCKEGDGVEVFDGECGAWNASVSFQGKKDVIVIPGSQTRPLLFLQEKHLYFTPLKPGPLHILLEKATELGVTHLHPMLTQRTSTRNFNADKAKMICVEAAEQSGRTCVPTLLPLEKFHHILTEISTDQQIFYADERRDQKPLKNYVQDQGAVSTAVWRFMIGPEGGFAPEEFSLLEHHPQCVGIALGQLVLRAETAALSCLAQVL